MRKIVTQKSRGEIATSPNNFKFQKQPVVSNLKREHKQPKRVVPVDASLIQKIRNFTSSKEHNYYLGFGGLGDAILLLATCWNDPKSRVVFFANQQSFVKQFFDLFKIGVFLHDNIMGNPSAGQIYDIVTKNPNFKQSAHLADGLFYGDWVNENKYIPRIKKYVPWIEKLGMVKYAEPVFLLAPSGSQRDTNRQRFLTPDEYKALIHKHLSLGYRVFACGSISDFHMYGVVSDERFSWLSSDKIIDYKKGFKNINLHEMLQIINSASKVISVDTWLKSYTLICNIPTVVVQTRWQGKYISYGSDVTDWIFLNPNLWQFIKLEKIENLLL